MRKLESDQKIFEERFNDTLGQPSFAVLLQKSVIGSAKTGSREKHKILAKLVAERLLHDEESILSLNAENWVEKVLRLNKWHFLILKFIDIIYSLSNKEFLQTPFIEKNKIYTDKGCLNDIYDEIKKKINENNKPTAELALLIANLEGNDCLVYRPRRGRENLEKSILNQDIKNNIGISEEKAQLFLNSDEYRDLNSFYLQASMDQFAPTLFGVMLFQYFDGSFNPPSDIYSQTSAS